MTSHIRVAVNGQGVISKRVADAVRLQDDMTLAGAADGEDGRVARHSRSVRRDGRTGRIREHRAGGTRYSSRQSAHPVATPHRERLRFEEAIARGARMARVGKAVGVMFVVATG